MNLRKYIFFIATVFATIIGRIFAQPTNIKFDQIGLEQGLSKSIVYARIQDANSFLYYAQVGLK
jgi:hypothetical protein